MKRTALFIMIVTVASKILGFTRDLTLSYFYGATDISDAYLISLTIPNVIFALIGVGINNGFIPMYAKIENKQGVESAEDYTSNVTNIMLIITFIVFLFAFFFTEDLVNIFAKGFTKETLKLAVSFTRVTLIGIFFTGLTFIFKGYLQVKNSFIIPAMTGFTLNIFTILSVYISSKGNLMILAFGSLVAIISQFFFLLPELKKNGYKHKLHINFRDENIKNMAIIVLPIILGSSVDQINLLVDRTIASSISVGGISAMNYANKLNQFVQGLFVLSSVTVMYPMISKMAIERDYNSLTKLVRESVSLISLVVIPLSVITMIFSKEIVEILFKRGNFDDHATILTTQALFYIAIGMLGFGLREVLTRVFYAMQDTKTPVINGSIALIFNIILNVILSKFMGIAGLALATSISVTLCTILLGYELIKRLKYSYTKELLVVVIKIFGASIFMGIAAYSIFTVITKSTDVFIGLVISNILGIIIYVLLLMLFKVSDIMKLAKYLKNKVKK